MNAPARGSGASPLGEQNRPGVIQNEARMADKQKVGFIGLGTIGRPMATNIVRKGFPLTVFDLNQAAMAALIERGAEGRATAAEVARASDVVITMVPDAPDVEKAALGQGGVIEGIRRGAIYMDMSTVDPGTSRRIGKAMADKGVRMVDAPVARMVDNAWAGTLSIMIGGAPADAEEVMPILETMGDTFTYCGPLGTGHAMKLVNNYISAGIMALHTEALTFGVKAGLKLEDIIGLVMSTFAGSRQLGEYLPGKTLRGDFEPGFFTRLSLKDERLALTLAKEMGVDTPVGRGVFEALETACSQGHATKDFASVLPVREAEAGIEVRLADKAGG
jgi:3-hydroxyisobutyrate dehydrogenase-like beta-hydroxyacid dehydrogenase